MIDWKLVCGIFFVGVEGGSLCSRLIWFVVMLSISCVFFILIIIIFLCVFSEVLVLIFRLLMLVCLGVNFNCFISQVVVRIRVIMVMSVLFICSSGVVEIGVEDCIVVWLFIINGLGGVFV